MDTVVPSEVPVPGENQSLTMAGITVMSRELVCVCVCVFYKKMSQAKGLSLCVISIIPSRKFENPSPFFSCVEIYLPGKFQNTCCHKTGNVKWISLGITAIQLTLRFVQELAALHQLNYAT